MGKIVLASNFSFLIWLSGLARVLAELTSSFRTTFMAGDGSDGGRADSGSS